MGQPVMFGIAPRFPQVPYAGKYHPGRPIKTNRLPAEHKNSGKFLGCLASQIPLFKMTIVGPLPWGSSGHHKSKNRVNNHLFLEERMCRDCHLNRRDFVGLSAAAVAGGLVAAPALLAAAESPAPQWDPSLPLAVPGKEAQGATGDDVYAVQAYRDHTSYRNWGSIHTELPLPRNRSALQKT